MNTQDHAERVCATRDNRKTTQNGISEKHLLHINRAPIGEELKEEYHADFVSWTVTKTSIAMPAESRKGGVVN